MYQILFMNPEALFRAIGITLAITFISSAAGTALGVGYWLIARGPLKPIAYWISDAIRAIPNLVLIFAVYYFPFRSLGLIVPNATASAILGLAIAQIAYTADSLRAAEAQVPRGQIDGLFGIGATQGEISRLVVVPNLIRLSWAPHVAFWLGNLKLSSLASVIGAPDLTYLAKVSMASTFRSIDAWLAVAVIYIALAIPLGIAARLVERHRFFRQ